MAAPKSGKTAPHDVTEKTKAEVAALVSFGNTQEEIANYLGISIDTLDRKYREELDNSVLVANAKVATRLFKRATDGDDLTAMIFWLKTRARWREKSDDESKNSLQELTDTLRDIVNKCR